MPYAGDMNQLGNKTGRGAAKPIGLEELSQAQHNLQVLFHPLSDGMHILIAAPGQIDQNSFILG